MQAWDLGKTLRFQVGGSRAPVQMPRSQTRSGPLSVLDLSFSICTAERLVLIIEFSVFVGLTLGQGPLQVSLLTYWGPPVSDSTASQLLHCNTSCPSNHGVHSSGLFFPNFTLLLMMP
jgi:hypothetical protein